MDIGTTVERGHFGVDRSKSSGPSRPLEPRDGSWCHDTTGSHTVTEVKGCGLSGSGRTRLTSSLECLQ